MKALIKNEKISIYDESDVVETIDIYDLNEIMNILDGSGNVGLSDKLYMLMMAMGVDDDE